MKRTASEKLYNPHTFSSFIADNNLILLSKEDVGKKEDVYDNEDVRRTLSAQFAPES